MSLIFFLAAKLAMIFDPMSECPLMSKGFKIQSSQKLKCLLGLYFVVFCGKKMGSNSIWHESRVHDGDFKKKFRSVAHMVPILWPPEKMWIQNIQMSKIARGENCNHQEFVF